MMAGTAGCGGLPTVPTRVAELDMSIPRDATGVALQAAITKMSDPKLEKSIQAMLAQPEMRAVQHELVAGIIDGTLATMSEKERVDRINKLANNALAGVLRQAHSELPLLAKNASREAVTGALDEALSTDRRQKLHATLDALVADGMQTAAQGLRDADVGGTLSREMTTKLGPAFRASVRDNLAPGAADILSNEAVRRELGETARVLGREMVLGATEALNQQKEPADGSLLARISTLASQGAKLFGSAAWLLLLVIVALFVWIGKLIAQAKNYRAESERREAATRLLEVAAKASHGKPWSDELLGSLRQTLHEEEAKAIPPPRPTWRSRKRTGRTPVPTVKTSPAH